MTVVGVYVDNLLVQLMQLWYKIFFISMGSLSIKDLWEVQKFLGMRIELDKRNGYTFDQQATIEELLEQHGLTDANEQT